MEEFNGLPIRDTLPRDPLPLLKSLPVDLLGEKGRKRLKEIEGEMSKKLKRLMQRHYGFNPENS